MNTMNARLSEIREELDSRPFRCPVHGVEMIARTVVQGLRYNCPTCQCKISCLVTGRAKMRTKTFIGAIILRAREAKGWSRYRLAKEAGVSAQQLHNLERDVVSPRFSTLSAIAVALQLPADCFRKYYADADGNLIYNGPGATGKPLKPLKSKIPPPPPPAPVTAAPLPPRPAPAKTASGKRSKYPEVTAPSPGFVVWPIPSDDPPPQRRRRKR